MFKKIVAFTFITTFIGATPTVEQGFEYQQNEQFAEAIACFKEILSAEPHNIQAYFGLGCAELALGNKEETLAAFDRILMYAPTAVPVLYNRAYAYKTFGDVETAIELYKEIIELSPDYEPAQLALGFAYITNGDFEHGWQQHQRYLQQSGKNGDALRKLLFNKRVGYKKIYLHPEGDLGDTIHFIRYAQRLKNMGADIIVACQKALIPLLSRCEYIDELLPIGAPTPKYDADATFMSCPAIFGDDETTVPHEIPYIHADPALVNYWHDYLAQDTNFKIGLCWQANVKNDESKLPIARRGIPLQSFAALQDIAGVSLYSLQKYDGTEQLADIPDFNIHVFENLDEGAGAFMDTAAIIKNIDLVITVDTAIAHLAGALGCNVWLVHPYATADWRWIAHRSDSYWYPTMRIFKQQKPFDYDGVMEVVKGELSKIISK